MGGRHEKMVPYDLPGFQVEEKDFCSRFYTGNGRVIRFHCKITKEVFFY